MTFENNSADYSTLRHLPGGGAVTGICEPKFARLLDAFESNFLNCRENGASLCVIQHGETVVDIWGGWADAGRIDPWRAETMSVVYSCTKGMAALCLHLLVQDGAVNYDDAVESIWPAFAQGGKAGTTIAMLLNHASPVPQFRKPLKEDGQLDWDYMVERIEQEAAFWTPGSTHGYHGLNFAWTVGNVVRILAGKPLGQFFRERIATPLQIEAHIGLEASFDPHLAKIIPTARDEIDFASPFYTSALADRSSPAGLFLAAINQEQLDTPPYHHAEIASANGIANARGLARLYMAMIEPDGLLKPETISSLSSFDPEPGYDEVLCRKTQFNGGFMKAMPSEGAIYDGFHVSQDAFGHVGMGGSVGLADPGQGIGFGYTMNRLGPSVLLNERGQKLIDALYETLG